jgi:hypothetical protein
MAAGGPIQVPAVKGTMGFRVVYIAQIMNGDHPWNGAVDRQDMGRNEEQVRWVLL